MPDSQIYHNCFGCDDRGRDIRQQPNGDLVCALCGRMVAAAQEADEQLAASIRREIEAEAYRNRGSIPVVLTPRMMDAIAARVARWVQEREASHAG